MVPNNARLPVIIYRDIETTGKTDLVASRYEARFAREGRLNYFAWLAERVDWMNGAKAYRWGGASLTQHLFDLGRRR